MTQVHNNGRQEMPSGFNISVRQAPAHETVMDAHALSEVRIGSLPPPPPPRARVPAGVAGAVTAQREPENGQRDYSLAHMQELRSVLTVISGATAAPSARPSQPSAHTRPGTESSRTIVRTNQHALGSTAESRVTNRLLESGTALEKALQYIASEKQEAYDVAEARFDNEQEACEDRLDAAQSQADALIDDATSDADQKKSEAAEAAARKREDADTRASAKITEAQNKQSVHASLHSIPGFDIPNGILNPDFDPVRELKLAKKTAETILSKANAAADALVADAEHEGERAMKAAKAAAEAILEKARVEYDKRVGLAQMRLRVAKEDADSIAEQKRINVLAAERHPYKNAAAVMDAATEKISASPAFDRMMEAELRTDDAVTAGQSNAAIGNKSGATRGDRSAQIGLAESTVYRGRRGTGWLYRIDREGELKMRRSVPVMAVLIIAAVLGGPSFKSRVETIANGDSVEYDETRSNSASELLDAMPSVEVWTDRIVQASKNSNVTADVDGNKVNVIAGHDGFPAQEELPYVYMALTTLGDNSLVDQDNKPINTLLNITPSDVKTYAENHGLTYDIESDDHYDVEIEAGLFFLNKNIAPLVTNTDKRKVYDAEIAKDGYSKTFLYDAAAAIGLGNANPDNPTRGLDPIAVIFTNLLSDDKEVVRQAITTIKTQWRDDIQNVEADLRRAKILHD